MKTKLLYITTLLGFIILFGSCTDDLNVKPLDPNIEPGDEVFRSQDAYLKGLMKIYSVYAMSGQDGAGSSDIEGLDAGNAQLLRSWWILQEVSTDEAICAWNNDPWSKEINENGWSTVKNESIEAVYLRCMYIVAVANDYLRQSEESTVRGRGLSDAEVQAVLGYRNEARFMRALTYYLLMDAFARPPFITEDMTTTSPSQISRAELFNWIESEINDLMPSLAEPRASYGRVDKGVANALLARMYLNAEVYTGTSRYTDCITACKAIIGGGYGLIDTYANLFKADNNITSTSEIIFPICFDGLKTESWGGTTFIIQASRASSEVSLATDGLNGGGWGGIRSLRNLVEKFKFSNPNYGEDHDAASILDKRGIFYADNRSLDVNEWANTFTTQGWAVYKYTNVTSNGTVGSNGTYVDTDYPFFRLGEIYLNYAEAVKRGGAGGDATTALGYINDLRKRGYGNNSGNITASEMTLDFLLDERARELYWEGTRRTDLVRYGLFTSANYVWNFKGGVQNGTGFENYKNVFPIPASDLTTNGSLTQNDGYVK